MSNDLDSIEEITGLALCSGGNGLELGLRIAIPSYRSIALSEGEAYCLAATSARIQEGSMEECALAPDLRQLDARPLRGRVNILSAGFPCQPHSVAGKRKGTEDDRWLWPDIDRIIDECQPNLVYLENVAGLLRDAHSDSDEGEDLDIGADDAIGGFGTVLRDLAERGYDAGWLCLRASDVGASHQRKRVFILAYRPNNQWGSGIFWTEAGIRSGGIRWRGSAGGGGGMEASPGMLADPSSRQFPQPGRGSEGRAGIRSTGADVGDTRRDNGTRGSLPAFEKRSKGGDGSEDTGGKLADARCGDSREHSTSAASEPLGITGTLGGIFAPGPADARWNDVLVLNPWLRPSVSQAEVKSPVCNLADGLADLVDINRTDGLRMLGNGVVPLCAATAFVELFRRMRVAIGETTDTGA